MGELIIKNPEDREVDEPAAHTGYAYDTWSDVSEFGAAMERDYGDDLDLTYPKSPDEVDGLLNLEDDGISSGLHHSNLFDQNEDSSGSLYDEATGLPYDNSTNQMPSDINIVDGI